MCNDKTDSSNDCVLTDTDMDTFIDTSVYSNASVSL